MSDPFEQLILKYVQGSLSAEEQKLFDQRFEADPGFSEKVLAAMGQRLGAGPEAFLDRMGKAAAPAVDEAWRRRAATLSRETPEGGFSTAWKSALPVLVLLTALMGLVGTAEYMISRALDRTHNVWKAEPTIAPAQDSKDAKISGEETRKVQPFVPKDSGKVKHISKVEASPALSLEGHAVRFQNLPVSEKLTIGIFDLKGVCVRCLYEGPWVKGQQLDWDGQNDVGQNVVPGTYKASVKCSGRVLVSQFTVK